VFWETEVRERAGVYNPGPRWRFKTLRSKAHVAVETVRRCGLDDVGGQPFTPPVLPLLSMGQLTHVGKRAVFGLGHYSIEAHGAP
jgi:hypothetical protein